MTKQIRQGVFETNSSSTHSICIAKDAELSIPKSLYFRFGEFGWECDTLRTLQEKANYLYTGLINNERRADFDNIVKILTEKGIEVTFDVENEGYIDHANMLNGFLDEICADNDKLLRFLFSPLSFIITGNDNDDEDVDIEVEYDHDEYYKGN